MPKTNIKGKWLTLLEQPWAGWILPVIVALYITLFFNVHMYGLVTHKQKVENLTDILFLASVGFLIFYMVHFFTAMLAIGKWLKGWLMVMLVVSAGVSYIRNQYNVLFDETMIQNVMETDVNESSELLSFSWLFYILLLGGVPAFLISRIAVKPQSLSRDIFHRLVAVAILTVLMLLSIFPFYQNYASLLRSNRHIKDNIVPTAFLYSTYKYAKNTIPVNEPELTTIGTDAVVAQTPKNAKKTVMVIVVGETARAANFSLGSYSRQTNPLLQNRINLQKDILYFPNFYACGTTTSISVPCIFSVSNKSDFNVADEKYTQNLLDVFAHAGQDVLWIDNNSGCKGVCSRVNYIDMRGRTDDPSCNKYGCSDMMLVKELEQRIHSSNNNLVVVLHQKGSHGPSYYERIPKDKVLFTPTCETSQLHECTRDQIVNSYDNTIVYTDYVLDNIIKTLEKHADDRDAMMFYVSDHGESLGENNLFLHGMPYSIAPDEQTHVPAVMWLSEGFMQRFGIDYACLRKNSSEAYSHDNVFHTMLGLLDIKTNVYEGGYDMVKPCKKPV